MISAREEIKSFKPKSVYCLVEAQIDFYWSEIAKTLEEVPHFYDYYTSEWAYSQAKQGHIQVWALSDDAIRGIVLTRILVFPVQKVFEVMAIAGVDCLDYLNELDDVFEKLASSCGCKTIRGLLRPGLARKLRRHKAEVSAFIVSRPVREQKEQ